MSEPRFKIDVVDRVLRDAGAERVEIPGDPDTYVWIRNIGEHSYVTQKPTALSDGLATIRQDNLYRIIDSLQLDPIETTAKIKQSGGESL